jgi:hypothetical protein
MLSVGFIFDMVNVVLPIVVASSAQPINWRARMSSNGRTLLRSPLLSMKQKFPNIHLVSLILQLLDIRSET